MACGLLRCRWAIICCTWEARVLQRAEAAASYLAQGNAYRERGRGRADTDYQHAALQAYGAALAVDAGSLEAHLNVGDLLRELGRGEEAVAAYDRAAAILPGMALIQLKLVQAKRMSLGDRHFVRLKALLAQLPK